MRQPLPQLEKLVEESTTYLANHKRWINYLTFWKQGGKDNTAELLAQDTENIVEELSNSDQNLLLNKLMDYPVIGGYNNKLSKHINGKLALLSVFSSHWDCRSTYWLRTNVNCYGMISSWYKRPVRS